MTGYKRVFVDTAPLIYLLEKSPIYYTRMERLFSEWYRDGVKVITSAVTVEEYCVYPYKNKRIDLIEKFERFLTEYGLEVCIVDKETAKKAAEIRAAYEAFKAMDALQLSVAKCQHCDCFVTNDKQLLQFKELNCVLVDNM